MSNETDFEEPGQQETQEEETQAAPSLESIQAELERANQRILDKDAFIGQLTAEAASRREQQPAPQQAQQPNDIDYGNEDIKEIVGEIYRAKMDAGFDDTEDLRRQIWVTADARYKKETARADRLIQQRMAPLQKMINPAIGPQVVSADVTAAFTANPVNGVTAQEAINHIVSLPAFDAQQWANSPAAERAFVVKEVAAVILGRKVMNGEFTPTAGKPSSQVPNTPNVGGAGNGQAGAVTEYSDEINAAMQLGLTKAQATARVEAYHKQGGK